MFWEGGVFVVFLEEAIRWFKLVWRRRFRFVWSSVFFVVSWWRHRRYCFFLRPRFRRFFGEAFSFIVTSRFRRFDEAFWFDWSSGFKSALVHRLPGRFFSSLSYCGSRRCHDFEKWFSSFFWGSVLSLLWWGDVFVLLKQHFRRFFGEAFFVILRRRFVFFLRSTNKPDTWCRLLYSLEIYFLMDESLVHNAYFAGVFVLINKEVFSSFWLCQ